MANYSLLFKLISLENFDNQLTIISNWQAKEKSKTEYIYFKISMGWWQWQ